MMPVKDEHFVIFEADGIGSVRVLKDETSPKEPTTTGGWEVISRPHRVGLTNWAGSDPQRLAVPVVFEGFQNFDGQEIRISKLRRMALPAGGDSPPIVSVSGLGIPHLGPSRWVIESIDWGDNVIWDNDRDSGSMVRLRQDCVVNLLQYVDEDRVAFSTLQPGSGLWPKHYTWKKGDTLQKVASKFYHNSKKWKIIAKANNIRDPKGIKPGRILIIPKP
jgi:nucleoid-associated protein YgaU